MAYENRVQAYRDSHSPLAVSDELEDVVFEGGFRVPADIYNRLFDYQKTGVRVLGCEGMKVYGVPERTMGRFEGGFCMHADVYNRTFVYEKTSRSSALPTCGCSAGALRY